MNRNPAALMVVVLALSACKGHQSDQATPAAGAPAPATQTATADSSSPAPTPATTPAAPSVDRALFADRVWRVKESTTVETGTTYAFLADGTLVIASAHGTPLYGEWRFEQGALTLIEEGRPYRTEILGYDGENLRLRSHNPGEPVDLLLVVAADVPLPPARPQ